MDVSRTARRPLFVINRLSALSRLSYSETEKGSGLFDPFGSSKNLGLRQAEFILITSC